MYKYKIKIVTLFIDIFIQKMKHIAYFECMVYKYL